MAGQIFAATLDGVNDFTLNGDTFSWGSNGYLSNVDEWGGNGPTINTFNLTLLGAFDVGNLHLGGFAVTNITDSLDGISRSIETLRLSGEGGTVNLTTTYVEVLKVFFIAGAPGDNITLGTAGAGSIELGDGNDTVHGGSGDISYLRLGNGNNTFVGGTGFVGSITANNGNDTVSVTGNADTISLGSGNETITTGAGFVGSIICYSNDADITHITLGSGNVRTIGLSNAKDTVTIQAGGSADVVETGANDDTINLKANATIESLYMGDGNNTLNLAAGARVSSVKGDNGDDTINLVGDSRILLLKLDGGNNTVTTDTGNVESLYSFGGNNTLDIGAGGVQQIVLSGDGTQHLNSKGFIGSLQCYDQSTTTAVFNGGVISVFTGKGNDNITIGDNQFAGSVQTWEGNDTVTGGLGADFRSSDLGIGDDVLKLNTIFAGSFAAMQGNLGTDLIDFSQNAAGVTISLNLNGAYQALGAGNVSLSGFENMNGSTGADHLEGDATGNVINGLGGADLIRGLGGNDTLFGGFGNDKLTGGLGADQFEFAGKGGKDEVTDFALGTDHLHFAGTHTLAGITFATQGTGVLLTVGTTSALVDHVTLAQMHDAANFVFG